MDFPERGRGADVTASELGTFAFCAKAWHLERVLGKTPSRAAARRRASGVGEHVAHGSRVRRLQRSGGRWVWGSVLLLVLALALLIAALVLSRS